MSSLQLKTLWHSFFNATKNNPKILATCFCRPRQLGSIRDESEYPESGNACFPDNHNQPLRQQVIGCLRSGSEQGVKP